MVFHEDVLGGATLSVLRLVAGLEERGWRFSFWVSRPSALYDELARRGHEVRGAPRPMAFSLKALRLPPGAPARLRQLPGYVGGFVRCLRRTRPDLVHANSLYTVAEASLARLSGVPSLLHVHEMMPRGRKGRAAPGLAHACTRHVVAVSQASAAELSVNGRRPTVVYEGARVPSEPVTVRPDPRPFVFGTVGVISTRKGSDVFVEAARRLGDRQGQLEFRMIGSPTDALEADWGRAVIEHARRAGIVHADRSDVPSEIRSWDAFVLPSRRDPFPIAMLEAMGAGLPVIGACVDGIQEQITSDTGILVPPEDPGALAAAMKRLAALSHAERRAMGGAARERVRERFTVEHQAERLHRVYLAALGLPDA